MTGITTSDIVVTSLVGDSTSRRRLQASGPYVLTNYTVTYDYASLGFPNPNSAYVSIANELTSSIEVGNFTSLLRLYGNILGCVYLSNASSDSVFVSQPTVIVVNNVDSPTPSPTAGISSPDSSLSSGLIAGVVIVLLVALGSIGGIAYYWFVLRKKKSAFAKWDNYYNNYNQTDRMSRSSNSTVSDLRRSSARKSEHGIFDDDFYKESSSQPFEFVNVSINNSKREKSKQKIVKANIIISYLRLPLKIIL